MSDHLPAIRDPWSELRRLTPARIALGRSGGSVPTAELLDFQLAHARARDAVWQELDPLALAQEVDKYEWKVVMADSAAPDRQTYLRQPATGRRLSTESRAQLVAMQSTQQPFDVAVIVSDGLSALAAQRQTAPFLAEWKPMVEQAGWNVSPVVIVLRGRVAIQDEIGKLLGARAAVILLGERPGLGSPDSLGAYVVFDPQPGRTDAERNCISNIRPEGLPPDEAARRLHQVIAAALQQRISGIQLKIEAKSARLGFESK